MKIEMSSTGVLINASVWDFPVGIGSEAKMKTEI
jgi:hypothetical protein